MWNCLLFLQAKCQERINFSFFFNIFNIFPSFIYLFSIPKTVQIYIKICIIITLWGHSQVQLKYLSASLNQLFRNNLGSRPKLGYDKNGLLALLPLVYVNGNTSNKPILEPCFLCTVTPLLIFFCHFRTRQQTLNRALTFSIITL